MLSRANGPERPWLILNVRQMKPIPDGWTDDMRISIRAGRSAEELVDFVFEGLRRFAATDVFCAKLRVRFGLSEDDARLALDRVPGGIIRALTGNPLNRPSSEKDPLAHIAFERVWAELTPSSSSPKHKVASGPWLKWHQDLQEITKQNA